jgi:hypothetical protein
MAKTRVPVLGGSTRARSAARQRPCALLQMPVASRRGTTCFSFAAVFGDRLIWLYDIVLLAQSDDDNAGPQ